MVVAGDGSMEMWWVGGGGQLSPPYYGRMSRMRRLSVVWGTNGKCAPWASYTFHILNRLLRLLAIYIAGKYPSTIYLPVYNATTTTTAATTLTSRPKCSFACMPLAAPLLLTPIYLSSKYLTPYTLLYACAFSPTKCQINALSCKVKYVATMYYIFSFMERWNDYII